MKLLRLIRSRVKQYWVTNRLILCLFLVGGVLSSIAFTFFYGNMIRYLKYRTSTDDTYRTYTVSLTDHWGTDIPKPEPGIFIDEVEALSANDLVESVSVEYLFAFDASVEYDIPPGHYGTDAFHRIQAKIGDQWDLPRLTGSADFEKYPDGAVVPEESVVQIGDTFTIGGKTLTVIGKHGFYECLVSYQTFLELCDSVDIMTLVTKDRQDIRNDPMKKLLNEMYPDIRVEDPSYWAESYEKRAVETLAFGIGPAYAVSITSFLFLLRYLMDAMLGTTIVSRMVGATKGKIFALCLGEAAVLCAAADAVGIAIHWIFYDEVFKNLNSVEDLVYLPEDYLYIFLIMLGLGMTVAVLFVRKYAKLSPAASRRLTE